MASIDQDHARQEGDMDQSIYNDNHCPLFRLPLEIREEIYSYVAHDAQSRIVQSPIPLARISMLGGIGISTDEIREKFAQTLAPVSIAPVAFLSSIGSSTEQLAVLTSRTTTGLSCACKRTRQEFSKALHVKTTKIAVHVVNLDFSPFIAFHKSWTDRERRKTIGHPSALQTMHSGCIMFVHWNNSNSAPCRVGHQHDNCEDCWRQRNIKSWLDYQQCLDKEKRR